MHAGQYNRQAGVLGGLAARSHATDADKQHYYGRPHQRPGGPRDDAAGRHHDNQTGHLAGDSPQHRRQQQRQQQQQQQQQQAKQDSPVSRVKSDHFHGNGDVQRDDPVSPVVETNEQKVVSYELDHLATFDVTGKRGLTKPSDVLERLKEMEATIGVWTMKIILRVDHRDITVVDRSSNKDIERFAISRVTNPTSVSAADLSSSGTYNHVVIFTVRSETASNQSSEMHLFQADSIQQAKDTIDSINTAISGRLPQPMPNQSGSAHNSTHSSDAGASASTTSNDDQRTKQSASSDGYQQRLLAKQPPSSTPHQHQQLDSNAKQSAKKDDVDDEVLLLNHCFDDIERFVASLQQAANAQKEVDRRRLMTGGHDPAEDMLRKRAQLPPTKDFIDALQKFKLAFNLLPKLKSVLKDPDAVQLLHMLFSPLSVVIEACRDGQGHAVIASKVEAPLLTPDAYHMLDSCLRPREAELWKSLGDAWTTPSTHWSGIVQAYNPQFSDGWKYSTNLDDIGLSLPPSNRAGNTQQLQSRPTVNAYSGNLPNGRGQTEQPRDRPTRDVSRNVTQQHQPQQHSSAESQATQEIHLDASHKQFLQQLQARGARIYVAIASRDGKNQKELSVKVGDIIEVIDSSKNWWKVKNHTETTGFLPNTILKPFPDTQ